MTLKTVEKLANQIWNSGSKLTHNQLDEILTQDRQATLTALVTALEEMKGVYSAKDAIDKAKEIIKELLSPTI